MIWNLVITMIILIINRESLYPQYIENLWIMVYFELWKLAVKKN